MRELHAALDADGFAWWRQGCDAGLVAAIDQAIDRAGWTDWCVRDIGDDLGPVFEPIRRWLAKALGPDWWLGRSILFQKPPTRNWQVPWHQDLTLQVRERVSVAGFGPWSSKAGRPCVQAPADVLERSCTLRILLTPCGPEDGPLLVLPGSHHRSRPAGAGLLPSESVADAVACCGEPGDVLFMRPLLLHASQPVASDRPRRILHIECHPDPLPEPLCHAGGRLGAGGPDGQEPAS